jgi:uncharacterized membrane protein YdjX (TVP38/TMEM64 family)
MSGRATPEEAAHPEEAALPGLRRAGTHVALAVAVLAVLGWLAWAWLGASGGLDEVARRHGLRAALVLIPLQTLISLSFSPIPSDVVAFATSLVYGFWLGALFGWLAWMAGALIQYAAVRRAARRLDVEALRARLPAWLREFPVDHPAFLICGRWFPLGPHIVNTAAGALRVPLGRFTWSAAVGIAPVSVLIAWLASFAAGR